MKVCFVICPIGEENSSERIHSDWLFEAIIDPVFKKEYADFEVIRADKITKSGMIDTQIISLILNSDIVIADVTFLNPNVFYEIGIRHTVQKPIIHMHLEGQRIPFDIGGFRSIQYNRVVPKHLEIAKTTLESFIKTEMDRKQIDNPVTHARGIVSFSENASSADKVLLDQIGKLEARLGVIESGLTFDGFIASSTLNFARDRIRDTRVNRILIRITSGVSISRDDTLYIKKIAKDRLGDVAVISDTWNMSSIVMDNNEINNQKALNFASDAGFTSRGLTVTVY